MNELERIVREAGALTQRSSPFLLATVVRVSGSSYRRPGARMLVAGDRWISGSVSGGCLEGDVLLRGEHRCAGGPVVVTYDSTSEEGATWGVGLGCNGIVDVLLEHVAAGARHDALAFASACFAADTTGMLVTVIGSRAGRATVGERLAIGPACALTLPVTDPDVRAALDRAARGPAGVVEIEALGIVALVETVAPSPQLFVLGSGHDAAPLVALATSVGFRVTVADTAIREPSRFLAAHRTVSTGGDMARLGTMIDAAGAPYVAIMHHQLGADREALRMALASRARYIGVLGPARRSRDLLAAIDARGDDPRLHAPIGLDIGAETPEQIALAVVGEIHADLHRTGAGKLRDRARALHAEVATAVLAAGASRRLGRPKQLIELDGQPLVARAAATCLATGSGPVAVVLGAHGDEVAHALGDLRVAHVGNPDWREGIAASIRAAVRWAEATGAGALLIALADQPLVPPGHLVALRAAWLAGAPIAASRFGGVIGAPALFDRARWDQLARLDGDQGAGRLVRGSDVAIVDCDAAGYDVDTDDDLAAVRAATSS